MQFRKNCAKMRTAIAFFIVFLLCGSTSLAAPTAAERLAVNKEMPVSSNQIKNWPTGPVVGAASAILIEAETGAILYSKNIHDTHFPASTTKILTTLIASENCKLDEIVTFSHDAVFNTPRDSNHIAMDVGDTLTMEQCLNAILIRSANEVSFAVAEHISETSDAFAERMNKRAEELGCVDSNFVNPNGLPNENHYTSAYDLAKIGQAFFQNDMLCNISLSPRLIIPKEKEDLIENNKMELIPNGKYAYEYLVGLKTGYTDIARYTIVACAEKNGMKLICVLLKDEYPDIYEDTISLFNYGFSNFERVLVAEQESKYDIDNQGLFYGENDLFGSSSPVLALNKNSVVILPKTLTFDQLASQIRYTPEEYGKVAQILYSYEGVDLGKVSVDYVKHRQKGYAFDMEEPSETKTPEKETPSFLFINIITILIVAAVIVGLGFLGLVLYVLSKRYQLHFPGRERRKWKRRQSRARRAQIREAKRHSKQNYKAHKRKRRR